MLEWTKGDCRQWCCEFKINSGASRQCPPLILTPGFLKQNGDPASTAKTAPLRPNRPGTVRGSDYRRRLDKSGTPTIPPAPNLRADSGRQKGAKAAREAPRSARPSRLKTQPRQPSARSTGGRESVPSRRGYTVPPTGR